MNELALFAGVGGGLLGTEAIAFNTICAVELDWKRRCILARRQNDGQFRSVFPIWDDVCTFDGIPWRGAVDVVSGGFPCQAFSTAARGRNNAINLWPEMRRIIQQVEPKYVFAENVTASAIEAAAEDCAEMGYKTEMHTPTTKANYAAPSMQKWPSCRNYVSMFGKPTPEYQEWLMGWPIGWTDLNRLEMDRFQLWQQQLYGHLRMLEADNEPT